MAVCKTMPLLDARSARAAMLLGGLLSFLNAAAEASLGAILAAGYAGAGLVVGFVLGYCIARKFGHFTVHQESICASGLVQNPRRMALSGIVLAAPFMYDPDYVWDMILIPEHEHFVFDNASHPRCNGQGIGLLHCEIDSIVKDTACIVGFLGSLAGGLVGVLVLVPLLAAAAFCGPLIILCVILAFLIAAAAAYIGSWLGGMLGIIIGELIDYISGAADEFETLESNTCISVTGRWVMDRDHGHNEIHPVAFFSPPARDENGEPLRGACPNLCPSDVIIT